MRLTRVLFSGNKNRPGGARGNKKTGKHQEPHIIRSRERRAYVTNLLQETTNEMWLTRPYLKKEQEKLLSLKFVQSSKGNPLRAINTRLTYEHENLKYRINMPQHVYFEQRWEPLKDANAWKLPDKNIHKRRELEKFARATIPSRYPDFYPAPIEKWEEWNKVDGFGLNKNEQLSKVLVAEKDTDK